MHPIHHDQRRFVPDRLLDPPAKMHHQQAGRVHFGRDPREDLRKSCWGKDDGRQSSMGQLLLADHTGRLCRIREEMRQELGVRPPPPHKAGIAAQHHLPMVVRHLGDGHHRSLLPEKRADQITPGGVDYFTKWIEAEPLTSISAKNVQNFVWRSIVCRFSVSHTLITANCWQFIDRGLQPFYDDLGIKFITASVEHPQINGQAEAANKVILNELKKRLDNAKGRWTEELIEVL